MPHKHLRTFSAHMKPARFHQSANNQGKQHGNEWILHAIQKATALHHFGRKQKSSKKTAGNSHLPSPKNASPKTLIHFIQNKFGNRLVYFDASQIPVQFKLWFTDVFTDLVLKIKHNDITQQDWESTWVLYHFLLMVFGWSSSSSGGSQVIANEILTSLYHTGLHMKNNKHDITSWLRDLQVHIFSKKVYTKRPGDVPATYFGYGTVDQSLEFLEHVPGNLKKLLGFLAMGCLIPKETMSN